VRLKSGAHYIERHDLGSQHEQAVLRRVLLNGTVRFWHKADMLNALTNVRFWGYSGHGEGWSVCPLMTQSGHPLGEGRNAHFDDAQGSRWLRNGSLKHFPKSFTEGSKNVRHLPRDLSI
jgi:hypothetical protein